MLTWNILYEFGVNNPPPRFGTNILHKGVGVYSKFKVRTTFVMQALESNWFVLLLKSHALCVCARACDYLIVVDRKASRV